MDHRFRPAWGAYEHIQGFLSRSQTVDDKSFGLEAALNHLLEPRGADGDAARAVASAARRERHRTRARRMRLSYQPQPSVLDRIDALLALRRIRDSVSKEDWTLLLGVGIGRS